MTLTLNYGDSDEAPCVRLLEDKEGDLSEAQRDRVLADAGLEIPVSFLRKKYGLPAPSEGEESIGGKVEEPQISQIDTDFKEDWDEEKDDSLDAKERARVAAIKDDALFAKELDALLSIASNGTSEGNRKGWDQRGRGRKERVSIHPELAKILKINPQNVMANYAILAGKHPEYFEDAASAKAFTEHVLANPTHLLPANKPVNKMVV